MSDIDDGSDAGPALLALRLATAADRTTLRFDVPGMNFPCIGESCGEGVDPISADNSLDQAGAATARWIERTQRVLVQPDLADADPRPPQPLLDAYGVRAQMLAPVLVDGVRVGWISVHSLLPRAWSEADVAAIDAAAHDFAGRAASLRTGTGFTRWLPAS